MYWSLFKQRLLINTVSKLDTFSVMQISPNANDIILLGSFSLFLHKPVTYGF
jgi:hypothetical protein